MADLKLEDGVLKFPANPIVVDRIEEDVARAHSRYAQEILKNPTERSILSWTLTYLRDVFDIHARYHSLIIETADHAREQYDPYLKSLRENVEKQGTRMAMRWPPHLKGNLHRSLSSHLVERTSHWKSECLAYVRGLKVQELLKQNASPQPPAATPVTIPTRRGYRSEVRAWMKRNSIPNNELAARKLGVGIDTLKNIMSDKGKIRYSQETLDRVLSIITSTTG